MPLDQPRGKKIEVDGEYLTPTKLKNLYLKAQKELEKIRENHQCVCCGELKAPKEFYQSRSEIYANGIIPVCKECIYNTLYQQDKNGELHPPTKQSLIKTLILINKPFLDDLYEDCVKRADSDASVNDFARLYIQAVIGVRYDGMSFMNSDLLSAKEVIVKDVSEFDMHTKSQLMQDMKDVIDIVGYDPFATEQASDKPFLYSQLLQMVDDNSEDDRDIMKIQSCISIVRGFLQIQKLDNTLSRVLYDTNDIKGASKTIGQLTTTKKTIHESIVKLAQESCISLKNSRSASKGDNSWTGKLKAIKDKNLRDAEINGFDLATCKGMMQVLDLSHQSIMKQLKLDENDYTQMLAEQRDLIYHLQNEKDYYEEAFRLVLRENVDLKKLIDESGVHIERENLIDLSQLIKSFDEEKEDEEE